MSIIDDDIIAALAEAAQSFAVSEQARDAIFDAASPSNSDSRSVVTIASRHRRALSVIAVAACALLIAVPLINGEVGRLLRPNIPLLHPSAVHSTSGVPLKGATSAGRNAPGDSFSYSANGAPSSTGYDATALAPVSSALIEQSGTMSISVHSGSVSRAISDVTVLALSVGGYASSINEVLGNGGSGEYSSGSIVIAVPVAHYQSTISRLRSLGVIDSLSTKSLDVTGTYVDLQSHLRALQASRTQYLAILARASTIAQILEVQSQVDSINGQIDQVEGQIGLLAHETTYSTLAVSLHVAGQSASPSTVRRSGLDSALTGSVSGFVTGFEWVVRVAGPLLFATLLVGVLYFSARTLWRRRLP